MDTFDFLVITDMDYTLLFPGQPISDRNLSAAKAIAEHGGVLSIATGRTSFLTGIYTKVLDIKTPIITSNGAAIFDPVARQDIFSADFPDELTARLTELFLKESVDATGYASDGIYLTPASSRRDFIINYNQNASEDLVVPVKELDYDTLNSADTPGLPKFNKFLLVDPAEDILKAVAEIEELQIISSAANFRDIMLRGTSKGIAALELGKRLNIKRDMIFAIGDSDNDESMIRLAGTGIAMSNAAPSVLEAADAVTLSCAEDGFAYAVENIILPKVAARRD